MFKSCHLLLTKLENSYATLYGLSLNLLGGWGREIFTSSNFSESKLVHENRLIKTCIPYSSLRLSVTSNSISEVMSLKR